MATPLNGPGDALRSMNCQSRSLRFCQSPLGCRTKAGFVETDHGRFRKLQILTIDQLLTGTRPEMPFVDSSAFKRAKREESTGKQGEMEL